MNKDTPKKLTPSFKYFICYLYEDEKGPAYAWCIIKTSFCWNTEIALDAISIRLKKDRNTDSLVIINWTLIKKPTLKQRLCCFVFNLICKIEKRLGL